MAKNKEAEPENTEETVTTTEETNTEEANEEATKAEEKPVKENEKPVKPEAKKKFLTGRPFKDPLPNISNGASVEVKIKKDFRKYKKGDTVTVSGFLAKQLVFKDVATVA